MNKRVLIVGGGVAGLAAAAELAKKKWSVTVLEARARLGGRIFTRYLDRHPIELGAEFVHGHSRALFHAIHQAGLATHEINTTHQLSQNGKVQMIPFDHRLEKVINRIDLSRPDESIKSFLARQRVPVGTKRLAENFVEGFDAADAGSISAHSVLRAQMAAEEMRGEEQSRLDLGYSALIDFYEAVIRKNHGTVLKARNVRRINWGHKRVDVFALHNRRPEPYQADAAIITLPIGVWKLNPNLFHPALLTKRGIIHEFKFGNVVKVIFHFRERWWPDFGFIHSFKEDLPTWWTNLRYQALTGWAGGPAADELLKLSPERLRSLALRTLCRIFRAKTSIVRRHLTGIYFHNWAADSHSCGAYSYCPVGGLELPTCLATPVIDTLFFAGEATVADAQTGTVFGAVESGLRAAREVIRRLK